MADTIIIPYTKIEGGISFTISDEAKERFEEVIKKGAESLGLSIILEDNQNPTIYGT